MHTKFTALYYIILCLIISSPPALRGQNNEINYGLAFASYEVSKESRTSLNITPDFPLILKDDFSIKFDLAYQRLSNAYGYILRTIANDSVNIDLISSPDNEEFGDINLVMRNNEKAIQYEFNEVGLQPFKWVPVKITFEKRRNRILFSVGGYKKEESFIIKDLNSFKFLFGSNQLGTYSTSDVPPIVIKNLEVISKNRTIRKWELKKYLGNQVFDLTANYRAIAENPQWIFSKHAHWKQLGKFTTGRFPAVAFDDKEGELFCIDQQYLYRYNLNESEKIEKERFKGGNPIYNPDNQLVFDPDKNELINYDHVRNMLLRFNLGDKKWKNNEDTVFLAPNYGHHNKFYNTKDSSLYTFGGYGHYVYKNTLFKYDNDSLKWTNVNTKGKIPPRYLSASGFDSEGKVLLFGGYGSLTGKQELSPQSFYDLYSIDLEEQEVRKLLDYKSLGSTEDLAFSGSLVVNKDENCFYVLTYPKNRYSCSVRLVRMSLDRPEFKIIADSIPFNFHDENSFCELFLSKATKELVAVTSFKDKDQYLVNIYSIGYPAFAFAETQQVLAENRSGLLWLYCISGLVLFILIVVVLWRIRKKRSLVEEKPAITIPEEEEKNVLETFRPYLKREQVKSAMYFLGGFQVFNKKGEDITGKFSTTIKELFVLILMNSVKYEKGISTAIIREYLWPDKDEVSARNNRNVNIKKLRSLLEDIGDITIENNNSYIKIFMGNEIFFDYQFVFSILAEVNKNHRENEELFSLVLKNVKRGSLLTNMENAWLDNFKTKFSNDIADILLEYSKKLSLKKDAKILLEIADAIFNYDIVNEDALIIKCSVLNHTGKYSLAKQSYEHVVKEYKNLYLEDYPKSFNEVISHGEKLGA